MTTTASARPDAVEPIEPPTPPRVSPFALPASTTSQFLLLVTLVAAVAAFAYDQLLGGPSFWEDAFRACVVAGNEQAATLSPAEVTRGYVDCYDGVLLRRGTAGLVGIAAVAALVAVGVALHPRLLIRREGLVRFDPTAFPVVSGEIDRCMAEAGLGRRPELYFEAFRSDRGGRAFGTGRRPRVRLALALLDDPDPATLRAVVRHELAHVHNRDLTMTAMAVVVPYVFVGAVVVPLLLRFVLYAPEVAWSHGWRLAALLGLILLIRASVFRTREHYADVRASVSGPVSEAPFLAAAFPDARDERARRLARALRGRLGLLPHPRAAARADVVARPARLLSAGFAEGAAAGVTAGVTFYLLRNLLVTVVAANWIVAGAVAGIAVGALVATVTGQSMWRAALAATVDGRPVPSGAHAAAGLALGLVGAELLAPPALVQLPQLAGADLLAAATAVAVLAIGCLAFTRWCATSATTWLGASRAVGLHPPLRAGMVVGAVVLGAPYASWSIAVGTAVGSSSPFAGLVLASLNPVFALAAVAAAAFGLFAAVPARRRGGAVERVVLLDAPYRRVLPVPRIRPGLVLVPAVAAGLTYVVVDALVFRGFGVFRILEAFRAPPGTAVTEAVANVQVFALMGFFLAAEVVVVAGVAVAVVRDRVLGTWTHLLGAAVVTGQLVGFAFPAFPIVTACTAELCEPRFFVLAFGALALATTLGTTAVVLPAWLVVAGVNAVRRSASGPPAPMRPARTGAVARGLSAVGRVLAAAVALTYVVGIALALLLAFNVVGTGRPTVAVDVRNDVADRTPTTIAVACGAYNDRIRTVSLLSTDFLRQLRIARALGSVTDSGVLRSVGAAKEQAVLSGDSAAVAYVDRALVPLCGGVPPAPLPERR